MGAIARMPSLTGKTLSRRLEFYIRNRRPIPTPSDGRGPKVEVSALLTAKIQLHNAMLEQNVNQSELGRRMNIHRQQVERLVNIRHGSTIEQLESAFAALAKRLEIQVQDA